ncbi:MAG TPA: alpha/beta hydrolase [Aliidongia sp.]|nr:alpha/beta hydrolase [Aliidongia sp.]
MATFGFLISLVDVAAAAPDRTDDLPPACQPVALSVALAEGGPQAYRIVGELCLPPRGTARTVHLTVHGATYGHNYWNWSSQPAIYSYAKALTNAGYAVFDYDRIGDGQSSHPASSQISIASDAYVAHQVVQALRNGRIGGNAFQRVVLVGHSLGSYTSWEEAGKYQDVDGVILTGVSHSINTAGSQLFAADSYSAILDPRFANSGWDPGYLTTRPHTRAALFYDAHTADPAVIAQDEATKQTVAVGELQDVGATDPGSPPSYAGSIDVPVLLIDGQNDALFCASPGTSGGANCSNAATLAASERPYYGPKACLQTVIIPETGHDLNLHSTAPFTYLAALLWSDTFVGRDRAAAPCAIDK